MRSILCKSITIICAAAFFSVTFNTGVMAEPLCAPCQRPITDPRPADTFIDALFYRPVGLALIPVGAVLFVVSLPFSAVGGNVGPAFHNLVRSPAQYTFCRALGDI